MSRSLPFVVTQLVLCTTLAAPSLAQQQTDPNAPTGAARVRQRQGPSIQLEEHQRAALAVTFPRQQHSLEIVALLVDPQNPAHSREMLFDSRNAQHGFVTHALEEGGQNRQLIFAARRDGQDVEIQQVAGPQHGTYVLIVQRQEPEQPQQAQQAEQLEQQQQADAQQQQQQQAGAQQQPGQQQTHGFGAPPADGQQQAQGQPPADAQAAAATQQPGQDQQPQVQQRPQQPQQPQQPQPEPERHDAVIFVYVRSTAN